MSYEKMLKTELKKLPERELPKEDVTTIRDFIEDLNLEDHVPLRDKK